MKLQLLQAEVVSLLEQFVLANRMSIEAGRTDIHLANDAFLVELFREVFDAPNLQNLNSEVRNAAGLDLGDETVGLGIQVTAQSDLAKVTDTISKVVRHGLYKKYPRLSVFITTEKQSSYKQSTIDAVAENKLSFNGTDDVLDSGDLARRFQTYELGRLERIARILRKHFPEKRSFGVDRGLAEALERDLANSYSNALQRSMFVGVQSDDAFRQLALAIVCGRYDDTTQELRRKVLLRAARSSAVQKRVEEAETFLGAAALLPGSDTDAAARARIAEARGEPDTAIQILRDGVDSESKSTLLNVLIRAKGDDAALQWLDDSGVKPKDLNPQGIVQLCFVHLRKGDVERARALLDSVGDIQANECPYLLYLRGHIRLASVFPMPDQDASLSGDPLAIFLAKPILLTSTLAERLDSAIEDFQRVESKLRDLDLKDAGRTTERYVTWAALLHPYRRDVAIAKLKSESRDAQIAVEKIELVLEFVDDFDGAPLAEYLRKREALGGLDDQELRAFVVIQLHKEDHAGISNAIAKHRTRCEEIFGHSNALAMEIRALIGIKQTASATSILEQNAALLDATQIVRLKAQIAEAEGADPTVDLIRVYEEAQTVDSLRSLVAALATRADYRSLAPYAERLFALTQDPRDINAAARAFAAAGDSNNFVRVMERCPFIQERDPKLTRQFAWQLFQLGRVGESRELARKLRGSRETRDFNLEFALAIETGQWEQLAVSLTELLDDSAHQSAHALIQGAFLAQASGFGPLQDLIRIAVSKGVDDAQVLIGAYSIALEEGIEGDDEKSFKWFRRAVELSGPEGPIQQMELKEVIAKQVEWQSHARKVNELVMSGDVPLIIAASALGTTSVDVLLSNLVSNSGRTDPRQRAAVPLFSGRRTPARIPKAKRIALDVSTIQVLGWLKILPSVLDAFEKVLIPAGAMFELFQGQRRIHQSQKSRIRRARQIQDLIAGGMKVLPSRKLAADVLDREIGVDLAGLIRAANSMGGMVVRPAPVHKVDAELTEADMSAHAVRLTDMHKLLEALTEGGVVDHGSQQLAKSYFELQDKGWKNATAPRRDQPLFLDALAVAYLQTVQLLPTVVQAFDSVYIDSGTEQNAFEVLGSEQTAQEVLAVIDFIRDSIKAADQVGKIIYGARSTGADREKVGDYTTVHLVANPGDVDIVVIDDRALNKESLMNDSSGSVKPVASSLDVLEEMEGRGVISRDQKSMLRYRLRIAGVQLIPVTPDEICTAAVGSGTTESREFRGIRESIGLARIRETPRFPAEIPWFISLVRAVKDAVMAEWMAQPDQSKAEATSDAIFHLQPNPAEWLACWRGGPPPNWVSAVSRTIATGYALPFELDDEKARAGFGAWAESRIFKRIRERQPTKFRGVIDMIKELIRP